MVQVVFGSRGRGCESRRTVCAYCSFQLGTAEAREYASRLQRFPGFELLGRGIARPDSFLPRPLPGCRLARQRQLAMRERLPPASTGACAAAMPRANRQHNIAIEVFIRFQRCSLCLCGRVVLLSVLCLKPRLQPCCSQKVWWRLLGSRQTPGTTLCVGC